MDKESCIRNIINTFDENGVFSEEQVTVLSKSLTFIVDSIDEWMYEEVLPKTINADNELYGETPGTERGIIKKCQTEFK
jgi:hypothetical protein